VTEGAGKIKVWDSPTKGDANLVIPHDGNDFRKWDISSFPWTLYLEGVGLGGGERRWIGDFAIVFSRWS